MSRTYTAKEKARAWRYSINYGPEGEANYAMVYDADDVLVSNLKTYHAISVVNAMNAALSATEGEAEPVALPLPADKELPPITDRGFAGQIMDVAWPHYGGNHQTAEFWNDFGEGVRFALHYASPPSAPSALKHGAAFTIASNLLRDGCTYADRKAAADYIRSSLQPDTQAHGGGTEAVREAVKSAIITCHDKGYGVAMSANAEEAFVTALLTTMLAASPAAPAPAGVEMPAASNPQSACAGEEAGQTAGEAQRAPAVAPDAKGER